MGANIDGACPVCGQQSLQRPDRDWMDRRLAICSECQVVSLARPPLDAELAHLYATGLYEPGAPRGGAMVTRFHRMIGALRMRILPRRPGRLVDVGSGKGHFLDAARRAGWAVRGIELSEEAAAEARRRYGLTTTVVADWADAEEGGPFEAITFWHVLEHLPDPVAALQHARRLLAPDGVIVVSVPNLASWQARIFGDAWLHLDIPRHVVHFTPETLAMVLSRAGFEVEHVDTIAPEMEVLGVVQSIQNRAGLAPNLALRFLKRDPGAGGTMLGLGSLVLAVASLPVALAFALVACPTGHGASIQMVGRPVSINPAVAEQDARTGARTRP
jgi:2-polyprenyl-3-methyl-5-hydroxy-6-metoxy-1,4-benzoquinol methylase